MDDPVVEDGDGVEVPREVLRDTTGEAHCLSLATDAERAEQGCFKDSDADDLPGPGGSAAMLRGLPMSFIQNKGQRDAAVRFEVKRDGHSLYFTPSEVVFAATARDGSASTNVRMSFEGASAAPRIEGTAKLPGVVSYFGGTQSVAGAPTFAGVAYRGLYTGIDLTFSGSEGELKREFVVAPGADPSAIRMRYAGVRDLSVTAEGALALETELSTLTEARPVVYQDIDGRRVAVKASYKVDGNVVTFDLGAFDAAHPLVIDPIFQFSTVIGTTGTDNILSQVLDSAGNVYVGGSTTLGTLFPTGGVSTILGTSAGTDAFVAKLSPDLSTLLYSVILSSSSTDTAFALSIQPGTQQLDIFGTTLTSNFPVCTGVGVPFATCTGVAFDTTFNASTDYFVARLNAAGTGPLGSTYVGGTGAETGTGGIQTYANGDVMLLGSTSSTNFPFLNPFLGTIAALTAGGVDYVLMGLRADHTVNFQSGYLGGNTTDQSFGLEIDQGGLDLHVAGASFSTTFPVCTGAATLSNGNINNNCTAAAFDTTHNAGSDGIAMHLTNTMRIIGSTFVGDTSTDQFFAVDRVGDETIVFGNTLTTGYPTTAGAFDTTFNGSNDQVLTRLNASLSGPLVYSTFLGGTGSDLGRGVDIDSTGQPHVAGITGSTNFPVEKAPDGTLTTANDATVTKFNAAATALLYSTYLGGAGNENALAIDLASDIRAYVAGLTAAATFPTTPGAFDTTHNGGNDGFITVLALAPVLLGETLLEDQTQSVDGEDCLGSGDFILVTVNMLNDGDSAATTGTYDASFPLGVVGQAGSCSVAGCTVTAGGVTGDFAFAPPLLPGETFSFTYRVRIAGGLVGPHVFTVTADGSLVANGVASVQDLSFDIALTCGAQVDPNRQLGKQVHLPILNFQGQDDVCDSWIEVQNIGCDFAKAALVTWGEPGFCPPQAAGPLKVECTGVLKPGSTWNLQGAQVPAGSKSGILFKLSGNQLSEDGIDVGFDDVTGDYVCELLFFGVVGDADDYRRFKKAYNEGLDFAGVNMARASSEGLLAVDVHRSCPGDATPGVDVTSKYNGLAGTHLGTYDDVYGGYSYFAPLVYASAAGFNSILYIQNGGLLCSSVEIWFKARDDCLRATICDIATLAPGETFQLDANDCVGPDFQGSAWIRSTQVLGIVVDIIGGDVLMTYMGEPGEINYTYDPTRSVTKDGNRVGFAPLTYSEYQGWDSGIQVQNLSPVFAAKVKVYFLDRGGDIITTLVDWVCPHGSQTYFLPVIFDLPGNWVGSARVESQEWIAPGSPNVLAPNIVAVATLVKYSDVARTQKSEAIAYNLLPEHKIFDWQIGAIGGGLDTGVGLIAIPSVLKDLSNSGLTTEIAIANVVPKPGFTDLVIYFYDQNGLLDYVCQKLNEKQVEYIDLQKWGYIGDGFKGSAIISAWFWEHDVFDDKGFFLRNLVGLGAVSVERKGGPLGADLPGDESAGERGIPFAQTFDEEGEPLFEYCFMGPAPLCPGFPDLRPKPGEGPACIAAPFGENQTATLGTGSGWPDYETYQAAPRIFRDGVASTCTLKACPGTSPTAGIFDLYFFNNCDLQEHCITVNVNVGACGTAVHAVAFTGEVPSGSGFACTTGGATYIGDLGSSVSQPFSFTIPAGTARWTLMFHNNFGANACGYSFTMTEN